VDIDDDGDLDAFSGRDNGKIFYNENTGTATSLGFTDNGWFSVLAFTDVDGDGDLDVFIGTNDGKIYYQESIGDAYNPSFDTSQKNPFSLSDIGSVSAPAAADIDGDSLLDLFVGSSTGDIHFFQRSA
jgi:hypothetical protein